MRVQTRRMRPADHRPPPSQNMTPWMPRVDMTLLEISSIDTWVVLSTGMRSARNSFSAAATSRLQVSRLA